MRYSLFTFIYLFLSLNICSAQNQGYVEYEYFHPRATPVQRLATLHFDNKRSVFTFAKNGYDKLENKVTKQEDNGISGVFYASDSIGSVYFRDFEKKQVTYRTVPSKFVEAYVVIDEWGDISWEISDERKKIDTFMCRKAVGNFRGRSYTAWYAEEIRSSAGPWKLFGLPGLILEATDSENMFRAYAKKIVYPVTNPVVIAPNHNGKKVTIREYAVFMDNVGRDAMEKMKSTMPKKLGLGFTIIENKDDPKNRKFRDEKVFEWEVF